MLSAISSISNAIPNATAQPAAKTTHAPEGAPVQSSTSSPASTGSASTAKASLPADRVTISSAAQALQESRETSTQTAQEAGRGDLQAQHLLAKEAAARKVAEG